MHSGMYWNIELEYRGKGKVNLTSELGICVYSNSKPEKDCGVRTFSKIRL